ncbi:MAG: hypothetical protein ACK56I_31885, partial [bacterium]
MRGGFRVKLLAGCVRGVFIILARHISSEKQFSDDVVGSRFSIEFSAQVRCWQGGKSRLHPKCEKER